MTIMGLFIFFIMAVVGAVGLDVANLMAARNQLQITADAAAHAALYHRSEMKNANDAKTEAIAVAELGMATADYGNVLTATDIEFGTFDYASWTFTADQSATTAVRVNTRRLASRTNSVGSLLFQFVGIWEWDIVTPAIYVTYRPDCLREGYFAVEIVDMQSNNTFIDGFSICANRYAEVNNSNSFESGVSVCMPNTNDLVQPAAGFEMNPGLEEALCSGSFMPRILNLLPEIIAGLAVGDKDYTPDYIIADSVPIPLTSRFVEMTDLTPKRIHTYFCTGGAALQFKNTGGTFSEVVIVTDCKVAFDVGVQLEDVIIATTNPAFNSIAGSTDLSIGKDDDCLAGGGAQLLTLGGYSSSAKINLHGGQIIALGDIAFAANATGIKGASLISGGDIDSTSNAEMSYCATGMEDNFELDYFRLAG